MMNTGHRFTIALALSAVVLTGFALSAEVTDIPAQPRGRLMLWMEEVKIPPLGK